MRTREDWLCRDAGFALVETHAGYCAARLRDDDRLRSERRGLSARSRCMLQPRPEHLARLGVLNCRVCQVQEMSAL
jgi:hypothetical protein